MGSGAEGPGVEISNPISRKDGVGFWGTRSWDLESKDGQNGVRHPRACPD